MVFPAHIYEGRVQTCTEHCRNASRYSAESLHSVSLENTGLLAGLLHDCGKFSEEFAAYIRASASGQKSAKSVIHSFAGVNYILSHFHTDVPSDAEKVIRNITAEIIAFAIGSHHGVFDALSEEGENGFSYRLKKQPDFDRKASIAFFSECCSESEIQNLFELSCKEIERKIEQIKSVVKTKDELFFYLGMLARLVTSAVIEGDRRDTAEFAENVPPSFKNEMERHTEIWKQMSEAILNRLNSFPSDSEIQLTRRKISDLCSEFAAQKSGIYRLNVPTGAGKTLSGLRYAIDHCRGYEKTRIIYVSPLISITEQNAKAIREAIGGEFVLEHHSNVVDDKDNAYKNASVKIIRGSLEESWDSPVIVTTLVQLLNTLFSGRTSCIRRMNKLSDSVIIIDEVQTVPFHMLSMFNLAMNFLSTVCGASIILCSATQPCLETVDHSISLSQMRMIPENKEKCIRIVFRRNRIIDAGSLKFCELPDFVKKIADKYRSVLVICNKRSEAAGLWSELNGQGYKCLHLSSSMCMAHRRKTLAQVFESIKYGEKIICVSTQVIEAGVDISFEAVIRLTAGLDNLIQAAGRCNRSGEFGNNSPVYSVNCSDENIANLTEIVRSKAASLDLMTEYRNHPEAFDCDLSSDKAVAYYYRSLYQKNKIRGGMNYPVKGHQTLYSMLSDNQYAANSDGKYFLRQAFKTAGELFKAIESQTATVLVPYCEGKDIIAQLGTDECLRDLKKAKALLQKAKAYSVSLYDYELQKLSEQGALTAVCGGLANAILPDYYDDGTGVTTHKKEEFNCSILIL